MNARGWRPRRQRPRRNHWTLPIYAALLLLYPPSLRREYGADMLQAFRDTLRDEVRCRGARGALRAWRIGLGDLATSLGREWPHEPHELRASPGGWPRRAGVRRRVRLPGGGWRVEGWISSTPRWRQLWLAPARRGRIRAERARSETMQEKFDKFTERGRKVLSLSQEEAQRFNHNYIGTEHLLLGLIREEEGIGAKVLISLGVELERARQQVEFIIGRGDHIVLGEVGLTPRAKKVIELAVDEARRLGHHYIGAEHLLLGLIREGEGIAAGVLESLGVNLERARAAVMAVLGAPGFTFPAPGAPQFGQAVAVFTLVCRDPEATAEFYVNALGARLEPPNDPSAQALTGGGRLLRLPFGAMGQGGTPLALRAATPEEAASAAVTAIGAVELRFIASDIVTLHSALRARNIASFSELTGLPGAPIIRSFSMTDPDGRTLRFQGIVRA